MRAISNMILQYERRIDIIRMVDDLPRPLPGLLQDHLERGAWWMRRDERTMNDMDEWTGRHGDLLISRLCRVTQLSSRELQECAADGDYSLLPVGGDSKRPRRDARVLEDARTVELVFQRRATDRAITSSTYRLDDLAVATAFAVELHHGIALSSMPLGIEVLSPSVAVSEGSIRLLLEGAIFALGAGVVLSAMDGFASIPEVGVYTAGAAAALAFADRASRWRVEAATERKLDAEVDELRAARSERSRAALLASRRDKLELRKIELEIKKQEIELARMEADQRSSEGLIAVPPAASCIDEGALAAIAEQYGVSRAFAAVAVNNASVVPGMLLRQNGVLEYASSVQ